MKLSESIATLGRSVAYYPIIARWLDGDVAAAVFLCQFMYWHQKVGDREIYKPRSEIESETGIGPAAQRRIQKKLVGLGFLTVEKKGLPAKNYYRFHWAVVDDRFHQWYESDTTSASDSLELDAANRDDQSERSASTTSLDYDNEITHQTTTSSDQAYRDEFEQLWKKYPRKVAKQKAYEAYRARRRSGVSREELESAMDNYVRSVKGKKLKFVMHCSTFFGPYLRYEDYTNGDPDKGEVEKTSEISDDKREMLNSLAE